MNTDQLQVFLAYTVRFDGLLHDLSPALLRHMGEQSHTPSDKIRTQDQHTMIRYFNLCSEEHYLWENKMIGDDIWENWCRYMRSVFNLAAVRQLWNQVAANYTSKFSAFVEKSIIIPQS